MPLLFIVIIGKHTVFGMVLSCLLFFANSFAEERTDFIVNDDGGLTAQNDPRIALAGSQGFVVVWIDRRSGNSDVYLQRYDSNGYPIGDNVKVNDDANSSYQFEPAAAGNLSGEYALVWKDYRNNTYPLEPDIYFQHFDNSVTPVGSNVNLTENAPDSTKESPDVAMAEWGGGVVVWADYRNRNWDIYGQLIGEDGSLVGSDFRINDDVNSSQQHAPRVAVSPLGWFVVTWYDNRLGDDDIFIQRFDSLGNQIGGNVKINADGQGARQAFPDISTDGAGTFTVVWVDWRNGTYPANADIYSRKYDTLMTPLTAELKVNTDATTNSQKEPAIQADIMGNVAIVWSDSTSTSWDIAGQMIDVDGIVREANFVANAETSGNQLAPDVTLDGVYRYITWADNRNGNWDVYASIQQYNDISLAVTPTQLSFDMVSEQALPAPQNITVDHLGYNPQNFEVSSGAAWLTVSPATGITPAQVTVSVNTSSLPAGTHSTTLTITGSVGDSAPISVPVRLDVTADLGNTFDTLAIAAANVESGQEGHTSITARLVNDVSRIILPVEFDISVLTVDSIVPAPTLPAMTSLESVIDNSEGLMSVLWEISAEGSYFDLGETWLGEVFFTTALVTTTTYLEPTFNDTLQPLVATAITSGTPATVSGEIMISPATDVEQNHTEAASRSYSLAQNWPNPFNARTLIAYELPVNSDVRLEVYNILGQPIRLLISAPQVAGSYTAVWDGCLDNGQAAPSGVYFCRLEAGTESLVRRMVLVK